LYNFKKRAFHFVRKLRSWHAFDEALTEKKQLFFCGAELPTACGRHASCSAPLPPNALPLSCTRHSSANSAASKPAMAPSSRDRHAAVQPAGCENSCASAGRARYPKSENAGPETNLLLCFLSLSLRFNVKKTAPGNNVLTTRTQIACCRGSKRCGGRAHPAAAHHHTHTHFPSAGAAPLAT
jgi:hypothetical protein